MLPHTDSGTVGVIRGFTDAIQHAQQELQNEENRLLQSGLAMQEVQKRVDALRQAEQGGPLDIRKRLEALRAERVKLQHSLHTQREHIRGTDDYLTSLRAPRLAMKDRAQQLHATIRSLSRQYVMQAANAHSANLAPCLLPDRCTIAQQQELLSGKRAERDRLREALEETRRRCIAAQENVRMLTAESSTGIAVASSPDAVGVAQTCDPMDSGNDITKVNNGAHDLQRKRDRLQGLVAACGRARDDLRERVRALCTAVEHADTEQQSQQKLMRAAMNDAGDGAGSIGCLQCGSDIMLGFSC